MVGCCSGFGGSQPLGALLESARLDVVASRTPLPLAAHGLKSLLFRRRSPGAAAARYQELLAQGQVRGCRLQPDALRGTAATGMQLHAFVLN